jgi:hypothetical protein
MLAAATRVRIHSISSCIHKHCSMRTTQIPHRRPRA